jgi:hypothetical protein
MGNPGKRFQGKRWEKPRVLIQVQWLMPVILATSYFGDRDGRIDVKGQPKQKV